MWSFDISVASHDDLKRGITERIWCRVNMCSTEYPNWTEAAQDAGVIAAAIHGGMPTTILPRY